MKKLAISLAIASALGLTACDDTSLQDVQDKTENLREQAKQDSVGAYVSFDPGNGVVNLPTDLLFSGTRDFTLETPAEAGAKAAGEAVDFTNPEAALGALDGWGTQNPFVVAINYDDGIILNPATIPSGDSVALYEMVMYPNLAVEGCTDATKAGQACQGVDKLQFGVDYFAQMTADGNIAVVPLKPLKAGTSYMLALTSEIKDSQGNALRPSSTYASVQKNIQTSPIVDPSIPTSELNASQAGIRLLQTMFSGFESVLERDFGANPDSIIYTQAFTTQSAGVPGTDPLQVVKLLNAQQFAAQAAESALNVAVPMIAQGFTVAQAFAGQGVIENNPATLPYLLYNTANIYGAKINVPYYLDDATTGNPLLSRWEAACDSGVALMQLTDAQKAALAANAGPNQATCAAVGLADFGIDTERHLTKYNPVPEVKSMQELTVQITVPNLANANTFRGLIGMTPITERPENGWPVVIL
jgi:Pla-1/cef family extracellular lipase